MSGLNTWGKEDLERRNHELSVLNEIARELNRSVERMRDAIAPYTRFVRTEHARMSEARSVLLEMSTEVDALKGEIAAPRVEPGPS